MATQMKLAVIFLLSVIVSCSSVKKQPEGTAGSTQSSETFGPNNQPLKYKKFVIASDVDDLRAYFLIGLYNGLEEAKRRPYQFYGQGLGIWASIMVSSSMNRNQIDWILLRFKDLGYNSRNKEEWVKRSRQYFGNIRPSKFDVFSLTEDGSFQTMSLQPLSLLEDTLLDAPQEIGVRHIHFLEEDTALIWVGSPRPFPVNPHVCYAWVPSFDDRAKLRFAGKESAKEVLECIKEKLGE